MPFFLQLIHSICHAQHIEKLVFSHTSHNLFMNSELRRKLASMIPVLQVNGRAQFLPWIVSADAGHGGHSISKGGRIHQFRVAGQRADGARQVCTCGTFSVCWCFSGEHVSLGHLDNLWLPVQMRLDKDVQ